MPEPERHFQVKKIGADRFVVAVTLGGGQPDDNNTLGAWYCTAEQVEQLKIIGGVVPLDEWERMHPA